MDEIEADPCQVRPVARRAQEPSAPRVHHGTAARHVCGDHRARHGGGLDQGARRSLAVGRQHHAMGPGDLRAHVVAGAAVVDGAFGHPAFDGGAVDGRAVLGPDGTQDAKPRDRDLGAHAARGLDVFHHALVAQKPCDHQENRGGVVSRVRRGGEMVEIDARTGQKPRLLDPHQAVAKENRPVIGVLEEDHRQVSEGLAIHHLRRRPECLARQEGGPQPGDVGNEGRARAPRRPGAAEIVLDGKAQHHVRGFCPEYPGKTVCQRHGFDGVKPLGPHLQRQETAAKRLKTGHAVVWRRKHGDPVARRQEGLRERPPEIQDVPDGIDTHQDVHRETLFSRTIRPGKWYKAKTVSAYTSRTRKRHTTLSRIRKKSARTRTGVAPRQPIAQPQE
jgi:hypothetical protein